MLLNLTNFSSEPIHQQIVGQILDRIIENEMQSGDELVSIGKLSRQQHVGKTTVTKAYKELVRMKIIRNVSEEKYIINNLTQKELAAYSKVKREDKISISEKEKLNAELEAARQIQSDMLPNQLPDNEKISVAAYSTISNEVGGDFYDFFEISKTKLGFVIADVSGKGITAAFIMAEVKGIFESLSKIIESPKEILTKANDILIRTLDNKTFVSAVYGLIDFEKGQMKISRAGHCPVLLLRNDTAQSVKPSGIGLGISEVDQFKLHLEVGPI